ncbi:MAG TPA: hypothetical protein VMD55_07045 [Terracidiphilus sp.]|nr:hypothetical protein [Terracidiphilus sp.]
MAPINSAEFETLWQNAQNQPRFRKVETPLIQADLSLAGILNQYMAMVARQREWGKLSQQDFNDLTSAIDALKAVLLRINDRGLVADATAQNAAVIQQKLGGRVG